jgi:dTDP-4-dehydrorhamnose reductase
MHPPVADGARWLVTGAHGQLGAEVLRALQGKDAVGLARDDLDLTDQDAVESAIADHRPDLVVNTAAYTAVDAAEDDEAAAYAVNALGPAHLAASCARHGARLLQMSTDYVFPGDAREPYDVDAPTGPHTAYGRTKLAGERWVQALLPQSSWIVRTAWVYAVGRHSFVDTMIRLERERDTVDVVDDQCGSPTWASDLAAALVALGGSTAPAGILHCVGGGQTTWCGLARAVFEEVGADPARVRPTTTQASARPARRPAYSVLSDRSWRTAGLPAMPEWRGAVHAALGR